MTMMTPVMSMQWDKKVIGDILLCKVQLSMDMLVLPQHHYIFVTIGVEGVVEIPRFRIISLNSKSLCHCHNDFVVQYSLSN